MSSYQKGFTLHECLIVIGIVLIIGTIAIPALDILLESNLNNNLQHSLLSSINKARTSAITSRATVELCPNTDHSQCNLAWDRGWYIHSQHRVIETRYNPKPADLRWSGFSKSLKFIADGSTPTSNGKFFLCHRSKIAWQIVLNRQGRARLASITENRAADSLCI